MENKEETVATPEKKVVTAKVAVVKPNEPIVYKVNLSAPPPAPVEETVTQIDLEDSIEEIASETPVEEKPKVVETPPEVAALPESITKLVDFMEKTGGSMTDYMKLDRNLESMDDQEALLEYYKDTKPHLSAEEVNFLMEDNFSFDEDLDDERDIKRKKLALKEQVASAKAHLDGLKSKYYEEVKAGSKLTKEQQEAITFFNEHKVDLEKSKQLTKDSNDIFNKRTDEVFNDKFKGFEFDLGDKKFRFKVKDAGRTKETQGDINNFIKKFLNEDNNMNDAVGYHKGLYTAMNPDMVAKHFYEQGKADAIKDTVANAKNINTQARGSHSDNIDSGVRFKVLGDDSKSFGFKLKK